MIEPKQVEEVKKICNKVKQRFWIIVYSASAVLGLIGAVLSSIIFNSLYGAHWDIRLEALGLVITLAIIIVVFFFLLLRIFKIKNHGVYETNKSIDECWEEQKNMEIYAVFTFSSTKILDRKDDELTLETSTRHIIGPVIKKTMRCKRTEENYPKSMKIDLYVDDKLMGQDKIRIMRIDNKTITEFDTEYMIKKNFLEYLLHRVYAYYNPQIMEKLGYVQKKYRLTLSLAK